MKEQQWTHLSNGRLVDLDGNLENHIIAVSLCIIAKTWGSVPYVTTDRKISILFSPSQDGKSVAGNNNGQS